MTAERLIGLLERGRGAWLAPAIAAALAVLPGIPWSVPAADGVPFVVAWATVVIVATIAVTGLLGRRPTGFEAIPIVVGAAILVGDLTLLPTQGLRDLDLYLRAGSAWANGQPAYLDHLLTEVPADRTQYPFNYPPLTLPLFGALAVLPKVVVHAGWLAMSAGLALVALRAFGLSWRWALAALLWRPFAEGLWVGNVAVPLLAAFALAPRAGALLAVPGLFKVYAAIPAAWLLRERRWRDATLGAAVVAIAVVATLPLVGVDAWRAWLAGLAWWEASIPILQGYGSGIALGQWLGLPIALLAAAVAFAFAIRAQGREGLWRLGVVTPLASPSVFSHGLLTALPALLELRPVVLWLAIASAAATPGPVFWVAAALAVASWFVPALRTQPAAAATERS
ncbi:MAG TPA: glycosyltransferase 87 family protein [Candidatus Polarisedimenticolia bacterium]|nr:glycosyltransferase 87 family protein [Candidatus Polarisedimenticolia bacterium]